MRKTRRHRCRGSPPLSLSIGCWVKSDGGEGRGKCGGWDLEYLFLRIFELGLQVMDGVAIL